MASSTDDQAPGVLIRSVPLFWLWPAVLFVDLILVLGVTPINAIKLMLAEKGVGDEGTYVIAFIAGYTLPLTVGVAVLFWLWLAGVGRPYSPWTLLFIAGVLFASSWISGIFGLGLLPDYASSVPQGPPYLTLLEWVLLAYLKSYGWALVVAGVLTGCAVAVQGERWVRSTNPQPE